MNRLIKLIPLCTVAAALLAFGGIAISNGEFSGEQFPIRWIEIEGTFDRVSAEQVRAVATTAGEQGYMAVDLPQLRDALADLPWVQRVEVRKHWPDRLWVRVAEYAPVARWNDHELLAADGKPFAATATDNINALPWLRGPDDAAIEVLAIERELRGLLDPAGLDLTHLELTARGSWRLDVHPGPTLLIGSQDPTVATARWLAALPHLGLDAVSRLRQVDLRYPHGFAVQWWSTEPLSAATENDA